VARSLAMLPHERCSRVGSECGRSRSHDELRRKCWAVGEVAIMLRLFVYVAWAIMLCGVDFFFQAEDGIRDLIVTGVQTCALPISSAALIIAILYSGLAGFSLPTERACIMLAVFILTLLAKRKINAWQSWSLALL